MTTKFLTMTMMLTKKTDDRPPQEIRDKRIDEQDGQRPSAS
jgi:hypothetical protein